MSLNILFGLAAATCWGIGDYCARGAARAAGTFLTLLAIQAVAIPALLLVGLPLGLLRLQGMPMGAVLVAAVINVAIMGGAGLLYRAYAIGTLSLVSPICASFAAVTAILALLTGEQPGPLRLLGIALALGGVVVASAAPGPATAAEGAPSAPIVAEAELRHPSPSTGRLPAGLVEALGATVIFGVCYWAMRSVVDALGGVTVAFIAKVSDFVVLAALTLAFLGFRAATQRHRTRMLATKFVEASQEDVSSERATILPAVWRSLPPAFWVWVIPNALFDTAANVAYNLGIAQGLVSIVVVLGSLFSAVTIVLAWIFLHERLARWQWVGVGVILVGVALVSV